jgi:hypothetical protein
VSRNPFVFLVGCPRSGTTLLQTIVDAHPEIAIFHELWWLDTWYARRIGLTRDGLVTPELVSRLLERGADASLATDDGKRPADLAREAGATGVAKML